MLVIVQMVREFFGVVVVDISECIDVNVLMLVVVMLMFMVWMVKENFDVNGVYVSGSIDGEGVFWCWWC